MAPGPQGPRGHGDSDATVTGDGPVTTRTRTWQDSANLKGAGNLTRKNREVESGRQPTGAAAPAGRSVPTGKNTVLPESRSLGPTDLVPLREERMLNS